ncbi:MAG: helix-turn-helix domain-containing protein [Thermaerobacter sp.]|nr:helix-turn-helix domain-containing protein [Thermaerobacter sp.]
MGIGEVLHERRKDMGLSIAGAARLAGIPRAYLSMIEAGKRSPNAQILLQLMRSLSITTATWLPIYLEDEIRCQHMIRMAQGLFEVGDLAAARQTLGKAFFVSRKNHDGRYNADIYYLLGRIYYGQGRVNRAARWFQLMERATRHAPQSPLQGVAAYNLAQALARTGKSLEALRKFDHALENFARFQKRKELGTAWLAKANVLLRMHLYSEAYDSYRRATHFLRRTVHHGDALLGEAITVSVLQGPASARPLFEEIARNPSEKHIVLAKARGNLGTVLRQLGQYHEAIRHLDSGLALGDVVPGPIVAALLSESAICQLFAGDRSQATNAFLQYKEVSGPKDSEDIAAMNIIASILGLVPPDDPIPRVVEDDFEQRVKAALELLRLMPPPGKA